MKTDTGYSIDITFKDWSGEHRFGITGNDNDSITLETFARFCYEAGSAYGFVDRSMDTIINLIDN